MFLKEAVLISFWNSHIKTFTREPFFIKVAGRDLIETKEKERESASSFQTPRELEDPLLLAKL